MRRVVVPLFALLGLFSAVIVPAHAWGSGTHAFIADRLGGAPLQPLDAQELYGAMAPDLFQTDIALNSDPLLFSYTQGAPGHEGFMAIWNAARGPLAHAFAWGWVGHNEVWGEDSTAHGNGYVIEKATLLSGAFEQMGVWAQVESELGFPLATEDKILFCHLAVEYAGDIAIRQADPILGEKIMAAATLRSNSVPALLVAAMAGANPNDVVRMEDRFRRYMMVYGGAMMQDDDFATRFMALDMTRFVVLYLQYKGVPDVESLRPMLQQLSLLAITESFGLIGDYMGEIEITIAEVRAELAAHGVSLPPGAGRGGAELRSDGRGQPRR